MKDGERDSCMSKQLANPWCLSNCFQTIQPLHAPSETIKSQSEGLPHLFLRTTLMRQGWSAFSLCRWNMLKEQCRDWGPVAGKFRALALCKAKTADGASGLRYYRRTHKIPSVKINWAHLMRMTARVSCVLTHLIFMRNLWNRYSLHSYSTHWITKAPRDCFLPEIIELTKWLWAKFSVFCS